MDRTVLDVDECKKPGRPLQFAGITSAEFQLVIQNNFFSVHLISLNHLKEVCSTR